MAAGAPANWSLLTGSPAVIERIWRYFGVWYQQVAEGKPAGVDWLTGRPLTYDVSHQDALLYLDATGHGPERQPPARLRFADRPAHRVIPVWPRE